MYHGIINVYKEKGYTSHDVVAKMRGILKQKKIGHTGTLDPDAQGVLPVCLGSGTKLSDMLTDKSKTYQTVLMLGIETDTQDLTGQIMNEQSVSVPEEQVRQAILAFIGPYEQIPPMYSALKIDGKKLYQLARQGKTVDRPARLVEILDIRILSVELPRVVMEVSCSKGTYIRTLCHDIGQKLGCGGCMESLLRTRVDRFCIADSLTLDQIREFQEKDQLRDYMVAVDQLFIDLPAMYTKLEWDYLVQNGNALKVEHFEQNNGFPGQEAVRVYRSDKTFMGVYEYQEEKLCFKPRKMFLGG